MTNVRHYLTCRSYMHVYVISVRDKQKRKEATCALDILHEKRGLHSPVPHSKNPKPPPPAYRTVLSCFDTQNLRIPFSTDACIALGTTGISSSRKRRGAEKDPLLKPYDP